MSTITFTHLLYMSFSDIRLDWQTFNIDYSDQQLLDFVVSYGDEFPLKDADGNEVVPPEADGGYSYMFCGVFHKLTSYDIIHHPF